MAFSCKTAALDTITGLWGIFERLHLYCGAYDNMYDGIRPTSAVRTSPTT